MKWEFIYYSERVEKDIRLMPNGLRYEFYAMKKLMEEKGPSLRSPFTKSKFSTIIRNSFPSPFGEGAL